MGKETTVRKCEIVTNLENNGIKLIDIDNLEEFLKSKNCIRDYAYIIHDKDVYSEKELLKKDNANTMIKAGTLKAPHIHLIMRFKNDQPQRMKYVANWFHLEPNFANKIYGSWSDACLYLIHRNASDKYQYSVDEVVSNFDYMQVLESISNKQDINSIIARILSGEIREYNKTLEIDHFILVKYARRIEEAFKIRAEYLQVTEKNRNTTCIFITGSSGVGKTTLAKKIAEEKNLAYFISSGSNDLLDGYRQEPCIIFDDIRPSSMELSDLLKMLDPYTASSAKSRYKNKYLNCELIILTTVLDINSFYRHVFSEQNEPILQLKRRFQTYIKIFSNKISVSTWDSTRMEFTDYVTLKNNLLDNFHTDNSTNQAKTRNFIDDYLPFLESQKQYEQQQYLDEDFKEISKEEYIQWYQ